MVKKDLLAALEESTGPVTAESLQNHPLLLGMPLDSLRVGLLRLVRQGLAKRTHGGNRYDPYHYLIMVKGMERLTYFESIES